MTKYLNMTDTGDNEPKTKDLLAVVE